MCTVWIHSCHTLSSQTPTTSHSSQLISVLVPFAQDPSRVFVFVAMSTVISASGFTLPIGIHLGESWLTSAYTMYLN